MFTWAATSSLTESLINLYCSFEHYIMEAIMKTVTAAEANRNFSSLLRTARQGEVYIVLSRGKPVATIGPALASDADRLSAKERLIARLQDQKVTGPRKWTRDELYED
jgi:prevent-host-death family protein